MKSSIRVGIGYDAHRFGEPEEGAYVTLGGAKIPYACGVVGHSDADVLVHAIMDAMLGAAGGPDIGVLFPNSDQAYSGIDSLILLRRVALYVEGKGYRVSQVDSTLIAEAPKVSPHRQQMQRRIAEVLGLSPDSIGIKATTNEGMGCIGRKEGIAAMAVCVLEGR